MNLPQFIRIEKTLQEAMNYRSNPDMQFFYFAGVQVLPNVSIRQRSSIRTGINLPGIYRVEVLSMCGEFLGLLPQNAFKVEENITDNNGVNQIEWTLRTTFDAGYRPVYLKIGFRASGDLFNTEYFTNPFYLTATNRKFVSRWFYRNKVEDAYWGITLQMHYLQDDDVEELATYDRRSTGQRVTLTDDLTAIEIWQTRPIDYKLFSLIRRMIACRFVYSSDDDVTAVTYRTFKNEAFETPKLEGKENHAQQTLTLVRNKDDVFVSQGNFGLALWSSTEVLMSNTGYLYSRNNP